jgi:hypothetical protein
MRGKRRGSELQASRALDESTPTAYRAIIASSITIFKTMSLGAASLMTICEVAAFASEARQVFTEDERERLIVFLASCPDAGDVMIETGGLRKLRWPARGQGKRGGARVIYYFRDTDMPLYLLAVYTKGEKIDLTHADKKAMRGLVEDLVKSCAMRRFRKNGH